MLKNEENLSLLRKNLEKNYYNQVNKGDNYLFTGLHLSIYFDIFLRCDVLSLKHPIPNLSSEKIDVISKLLNKTEYIFVHRTYNTVPKNKFSIWDTDTLNLSENEIVDLLNTLKNKIYTL